MLRNIIRAALVAGAAAATTWSVKRWLDLRNHAAIRATTKEHIRDWENEGGAVVSRSPRALDRPTGGGATY